MGHQSSLQVQQLGVGALRQDHRQRVERVAGVGASAAAAPAVQPWARQVELAESSPLDDARRALARKRSVAVTARAVGSDDLADVLGGDDRLQALHETFDFVERQTDALAGGYVSITLDGCDALAL